MKTLKLTALVFAGLITLASCKDENKNAEEVTATTEVTADENTPKELATASFEIEGMTCAMGCAKVIETKVAGMKGVESAVVDFENKTATVHFNTLVTSAEDIVKTCEAVAGGDTYKVAKLETVKDQI